MIYTKKTKRALQICFDAHKDQVDKSQIPYVFHPFHLADQMQTEAETVVALLHDVVEDSDYTFADLKHNSDITRLDVIDEKALKRRDTYLEAIKFLEE